MDFLQGWPFEVAVAFLFVVVMCRANATYWLGRAAAAGGRRSQRFGERMRGRTMQRAERLAARLGIFAVPVSFLTIGVQTAINFSAGAMRMPLRRYLPAVIVGCIMWAFIYATLGTVGIAAIVGALGG